MRYDDEQPGASTVWWQPLARNHIQSGLPQLSGAVMKDESCSDTKLPSPATAGIHVQSSGSIYQFEKIEPLRHRVIGPFEERVRATNGGGD